MENVTSELIWLSALIKDLCIDHRYLTVLLCENKVALHIAANPIFHECTKHIEINYHIVMDQIQNGNLKTLHVSSQH